jgi:hypothetical protein
MAVSHLHQLAATEMVGGFRSFKHLKQLSRAANNILTSNLAAITIRDRALPYRAYRMPLFN